MTDEPQNQEQVVVEARDLDTDQRQSVTVPAVRPEGAEAKERELRGIIQKVHPTAKFRSFAGDAATALDTQHLVVAHYLGQRQRPPAEPPKITEEGDQDELFAA